jgi:drug/metabolite transporter (DMT)-like permease
MEYYSERQKKICFIQVMLAGALWGTTGTITKYIYAYGVDPMSLGLLRIGISFVFLYLYALLTGKRVHLDKEHILFFLSFGAISVASFNLLYLTAIQLTTVTTSVVLLYTAPAFTMVAARFILKESVTRRKLITLALTFTGILLVVEANLPGQLQLNIPGVLTGLGAGLTYGVYSIFSKAALKRGYGTLETVILALGSGLIFILFVKPPWHLAALAGEPFILWALVIAVAVFSTMLAYVFFVTGLVHVEAGKATLITAIEPVVAITMAMIFLGETMTLLQFLGVLAVLTAVISQK